MPAHAQGCPSGPVWRESGNVAFVIHDKAMAAQGLRAGYEAINLELRFFWNVTAREERLPGPVGVGDGRALLSCPGNAHKAKGSCQTGAIGNSFSAAVLCKSRGAPSPKLPCWVHYFPHRQKSPREPVTFSYTESSALGPWTARRVLETLSLAINMVFI